MDTTPAERVRRFVDNFARQYPAAEATEPNAYIPDTDDSPGEVSVADLRAVLAELRARALDPATTHAVSGDRVLVHLTYDPDDVGSAVVIMDKPDEDFSHAVQVPPEKLAEWRAATIAYKQAQREMLALWQQCQEAADARARREMEAERIKLRAELAAAEAEQVKLDAIYGPREWVVIRRPTTHSRSERVVHLWSCPSAQKAARFYRLRENLRLADAVRYLLDEDAPEWQFEDGARPCGRCGGQLKAAMREVYDC